MCNLLRQLQDVGLISVELGADFRGTNTFRLQAIPGQLPVRRDPGNSAVAVAPPDPRQNTAADVRRVPLTLQLPSAFPEPTPGSGAGASGPAPSAAGKEPPAAPAPRAPGGRKSTAAGEAKTAKVIPLWDAKSADWQSVLRRHLNVELPGIPPELVAYALEQLRAAKADEAAGGAKVRSPGRYVLAVAKKHWGGFQAPSRPQAREVWRPDAGVDAGPERFFVPGPAGKNATGLSQGDPTPVAASNTSEIDTCPHNVTVDKVCPRCEGKTGARPWERVVRRQLLGVIVIDDESEALVPSRGARRAEVPPLAPSSKSPSSLNSRVLPVVPM
jgi:hypothetical protein